MYVKLFEEVEECTRIRKKRKKLIALKSGLVGIKGCAYSVQCIPGMGIVSMTFCDICCA